MLDARTLKMSARERLSGDHKKLALIHTGAVLGISLMISLVNYYLNHQLDSVGGLSGLGVRSVLETIQMVLQYAVNIALPFWEIGFLYAALRMVRGEKTGVSDLPEGFRRFGPVLRLYLIREMLFLGVGMACIYVGSFIFSMTPLSLPFTERIMPMIEEASSLEQVQAAIMEIPMEELMQMFLPFFIIAGVLFAVLAICLFYRFRMAEFIIMDRPETGAIMALAGSSHMTKGRRFKLFRLDLSFWWFYVLVGVSAVVMYADVLLSYLAVELPVSADLAWFLCYFIGCLIQLFVYWQWHSYVQTTYAAAYEVLRQQLLEQPKPQPVPKNLPWDDYEAQQ